MMIHNESSSGVIRGGIKGEKAFGIEVSSKAYQILFGSLYSDNIKAMIRELSCNAVDAHVAAGNPNPFDVHLPNKFEPYFEVRDYGTGLSHDDVMGLYSTLFQSTKTGSNDFVGALGLGSKTPFAVAKTFSVTSIQYGVKNSYMCFLNDEGVPSITHAASTASDEPTGLIVRVPVNNSRYDQYQRTAADVFSVFSLRPNFSCGTTINYNKWDTVNYEQHGRVRLFRDKTPFDNPHVVLMGNIAYPLDLSQFCHNKWLHDVMSSLGFETLIEMPIGTCDIQASREALNYNKTTISNLLYHYANAFKNKMMDYCIKMSNAPTIPEKIHISMHNNNNMNRFIEAMSQIVPKGTIDDCIVNRRCFIRIPTYTTTEEYSSYETIVGDDGKSVTVSKKLTRPVIRRIYNLARATPTYSNQFGVKLDAFRDEDPNIANDVISAGIHRICVIVNDGPSHLKARIGGFLDNTQYTLAYVVRPNVDTYNINDVVTEVESLFYGAFPVFVASKDTEVPTKIIEEKERKKNERSNIRADIIYHTGRPVEDPNDVVGCGVFYKLKLTKPMYEDHAKFVDEYGDVFGLMGVPLIGVPNRKADQKWAEDNLAYIEDWWEHDMWAIIVNHRDFDDIVTTLLLDHIHRGYSFSHAHPMSDMFKTTITHPMLKNRNALLLAEMVSKSIMSPYRKMADVYVAMCEAYDGRRGGSDHDLYEKYRDMLKNSKSLAHMICALLFEVDKFNKRVKLNFLAPSMKNPDNMFHKRVSEIAADINNNFTLIVDEYKDILDIECMEKSSLRTSYGYSNVTAYMVDSAARLIDNYSIMKNHNLV